MDDLFGRSRNSLGISGQQRAASTPGRSDCAFAHINKNYSSAEGRYDPAMRFLQNHFYLSGALLTAVAINLAWYAFTTESIRMFTFRTSTTVFYLSPILASVFTLLIAALFDHFSVAKKKTLLRTAAHTYALFCVSYVSLMIMARVVAVGTGELPPEHTFTYLFRPHVLPLALLVIGVPLSFFLAGVYLFAYRRLKIAHSP